MRTARGIYALVVAAGCATEADPSGSRLEWVAPLDQAVIPTGDAIELAVAARYPDVAAVEFLVDGEPIGRCDPAQPDEDCLRGEIWRWSVVFAAPGSHEVAAAFDTPDGPVAIAREVVVIPPQLVPVGALARPDAPDEVGAASRGVLDPDRAAHRIFGGIAWAVQHQRVLVGGQAPTGSVAAIARCMDRYGGSIRRWADHYQVSRASVVATAITESNCTNPAGSSDGLSSGPMQVTASTCAAITGLSRTTCRLRMHSQPEFSFEVGARYMGSTYQRDQHHRDPPKIAAAYNAGSLRSTTSNRWHLRSTGNHIDRFVNAYNAYRGWEVAPGAPRVSAGREARFDGEHVPTVDQLPASAQPGRVVFVGDLRGRDGEFYELVGDTWRSVDARDP